MVVEDDDEGQEQVFNNFQGNLLQRVFLQLLFPGAHLRVPAEEREGVQAPVEMLSRAPLFL